MLGVPRGVLINRRCQTTNNFVVDYECITIKQEMPVSQLDVRTSDVNRRPRGYDFWCRVYAK